MEGAGAEKNAIVRVMVGVHCVRVYVYMRTG